MDGHSAVSLAQQMASAGKSITLAKPDRVMDRNLGRSSYPYYLDALTRASVRIVTDHYLAAVSRSGNKLSASLHHQYGETR